MIKSSASSFVEFGENKGMVKTLLIMPRLICCLCVLAARL